MSALNILAFLGCTLAFGAWLGMRWADATHKVDHSIAELVMSVELDRIARHANGEADR